MPPRHPLRVIKSIVDDTLLSLDGEFEKLYEGTGRAIAERLLRASLLQAFNSGALSERQLVEQIDYNLRPLVRGARHRRSRVGPFDVLEEPRPAARGRCRRQVPRNRIASPQGEAVPSDDHFSVDGTLVEAWASRGFRAKDGNDEPPAPGCVVNVISEAKGASDTHESTTDPDAKSTARAAASRRGSLLHGDGVDREPARGPLSFRLTRRLRPERPSGKPPWR